MAQAITLQVYRGDQLVSTQTFERDIIKIGRLASAHLRLDDVKVARIHAVIEMAPGTADVSLIDMGSAEGTFLNGQKIQKAKLGDQDQITIGDTRLLVLFGGAQAMRGPSAPQTMGNVAVAQQFAGARAPQAAPGARPSLSAVPQQAAYARQTVVQPMPMQQPVNAGLPMFDRNEHEYDQPAVGRIGHSTLGRAAIDESGEIGGLSGIEPEAPLTPDNRCLELRLYWGDVILDINHLVKPKQVTIGETKHTDIFISSEGLPAEEFPLIRTIDGEYILTFFNELEGEAELNGEIRPLKELRTSSRVQKDDDFDGCYRLTMTVDTRAIVHWGGLTLAMRFVPPPQKIIAANFELDWQYLNVMVVALFLMMGVVVLSYLAPTEVDALSEDLFKSDNKFAQFILEPPKPPEQMKAAQDFLDKLKQKEAAGPSKAKGDEGKFGKQNTPQKDAHSEVKAIKPDDKEIIKNKGVLAFLGKSGGFSQVLGNTPGLGGAAQDAIGNLQGKVAGDSGGLGGLGLRGSGPGGGGIGDSIGLAKGVSTSGRIGGQAGYGSDKGNIGAKKDTDINIADQAPVVQGSIDPALIKKVINENRNAIKYCYERQLQVQKDLAGTVRTQFIIGPSGSVQTALVKDSTMHNAEVENCIVGKLRTFLFPKPKGGGIAVVNYPFVFKGQN